MVADKIEFGVETRENSGTDDMKRLRKTGLVPGVIYGGGRSADLVQLNEHEFQMMLRRHASEYLLIDLAVDGAEARKVLLKEVQHHPLTNKLLHVDFHEVSMDQKVKIEIAINFVGIPVGVTQGGGTADFHLRTLVLECLPGDIIESVDLDISGMDVLAHLTAGNIDSLDTEKYRVLTNPEVSVVTIAKPRVSGKGGADDADDDNSGEPAVAPEASEDS